VVTRRILPPPSTRSPSKNTLDWPGVTALAVPSKDSRTESSP